MGCQGGGQRSGLGAALGVVLLLALIWALVLVPPALRSHAARKEAFLLSFGPVPPPVRHRPVGVRSPRIQRRRRIAGGLLVAMAATLLIGLLPTFRVLLVVHLFLVDSFLAYIALLANMAQKAARADVTPLEAPVEAPARTRRRWGTAVVPGRSVLAELGPVARLG